MWFFKGKKLPAGTTLPDRSSATEKQNIASELYTVDRLTNPKTNQAQWPGAARFPAAVVYRHLQGPVLYDWNGPSGHTYLFPGFVGTFHQRAARIIPVIQTQGYDGILPTREQSTLKKPTPYS